MKNLNQNSHNFNEIFSLYRGAFKNIIIQCEQLRARNKQLQAELSKLSPQNILLKRGKVSQRSRMGGQSAAKLYSYVPLKVKHANSFKPKYIPHNVQASLRQSKANPEDTKRQLQRVQYFIHKNLIKHIQQDKTKKGRIQKQIIMRLYLNWLRSRQEQPYIDNRKKVKMHITNELKRAFVQIDHNQMYYRGIAFKKEIVSEGGAKEEEIKTIKMEESQVDVFGQTQMQELALNGDQASSEMMFFQE